MELFRDFMGRIILDSLNGLMGAIKGDTRSLDHGLYGC